MMTKTEENLFKLCGFNSQLLEIINPFKKSEFREHYWTDDPLYSYAKMSVERRNYVQGALSFLVEATDLSTLKMEMGKFADLSLVQTVNGLHLYNELEYEPREYFWGILQKLYKKTGYIQVSIFQTADVKRILHLHDFKFYGASIDNNECYFIIDKWTKEYNASLKCIAIGQLIDLWIDDSAIASPVFYEECLKICGSFLENGDQWKEQLATRIRNNRSFTLYDK